MLQSGMTPVATEIWAHPLQWADRPVILKDRLVVLGEDLFFDGWTQ